MNTIHIPKKAGSSLNECVLFGIHSNHCSYFSHENNEKEKRKSMVENWKFLLESRIDCMPFFIGMDADILLPEGTIKHVINLFDTGSFDCIIWPTEKGPRSHGLWLLSKRIIEKVPLVYLGNDICSMCPWFAIIEKDYRVKWIDDQIPLKEVKYNDADT